MEAKHYSSVCLAGQAFNQITNAFIQLTMHVLRMLSMEPGPCHTG